MIPIGARTATIVDDAGLDPTALAALRDRLPALAPYRQLDRGRYESAVLDPAAFTDLTALLLAQARRAAPDRDALELLELRAYRFRAGDYSLAHHDPRGTTAEHVDRFPLELSLDLSALSAPTGAELHYRRRGHVYFRVPVQPGSLAIVELASSITSNQTYLSLRAPDVELLRLVALAA